MNGKAKHGSAFQGRTVLGQERRQRKFRASFRLQTFVRLAGRAGATFAGPVACAVRRSAFKITLLTLVWLLLAIACQQVPAGVFWPAVFGALTTPVALVLTFLAALYWLQRNWRVAVLPIVALFLLWPQVQRGLALNLTHWKPAGAGFLDDDSTTKSLRLNTVRLLSANVRIFNVYAQLRDPDYASSKGFVKWLATSPADVLCLQEFYNEPRRSRESGGVFQTEQQLGRGGGRHAFVSTSLTNSVGAEFGLAIFSRFPIVRRGVIPFGRLSQNHAMWADLARPATPGHRPDTIRVFNLHLQSMSMADADLATATGSRAGLRAKAPNLLRRFRNGAVARGTQVDTVLARIARSPYPVLLAGDTNDLPYSYTYDQLADHLQNAWATAGLGIGATYNGRLPGLRIDQQFAGPQWRVVGCRVHQEIKWSDHFPIEGLYQLK
jgi:endonuclease/exonuclease/phosphatase family metal-dependent hydrolase